MNNPKTGKVKSPLNTKSRNKMFESIFRYSLNISKL